MKRITYPTQEEIKKVLDYDAIAGEFVWKRRHRNQFDQKRASGNSCATWNSRFVGRIAGCHNRGYLVIRINEVNYQAHKLAFIYVYGDAPFDDIDHINRVTSDNRIVNLRSVSRSQNMQNNGVQQNNTSGIRGVSFDTRLKKWHAYIKFNRKRIHLGVFPDFTDSVKARYEAEIKYGFTEYNKNSTAYQYLQEVI